MDETWEQNRIANEEDRRIVSDTIPDTIVGVELDGESTRIASGVSRATFTTDSRETDSNRCFLIKTNMISNLRAE